MFRRGNRKHPQRYRHPDSFMHVDLAAVACAGMNKYKVGYSNYARSGHVFNGRSIHAIKSLINMVNYILFSINQHSSNYKAM